MSSHSRRAVSSCAHHSPCSWCCRGNRDMRCWGMCKSTSTSEVIHWHSTSAGDRVVRIRWTRRHNTWALMHRCHGLGNSRRRYSGTSHRGSRIRIASGVMQRHCAVHWQSFIPSIEIVSKALQSTSTSNRFGRGRLVPVCTRW